MLTNLFSLFDPTLSLFSFSWLTSVFLLLMIPGSLWLGGIFTLFFFSVISFVKNEVMYSIPSFVKGIFLFICTLFFSVFLCNIFAIFPFIFSLTSHLLVTLPLAYSFWLGVVIFSLVSSLKYFLAHLVPLGTPLGLMSFMVLVEFLSNLIRPLALTFRLTANMMAGHLLMSLIGGFLIDISFSFILFGSLVQSLLVFMELGVSLIQAYVFSTLLLLYLSEGLH